MNVKQFAVLVLGVVFAIPFLLRLSIPPADWATASRHYDLGPLGQLTATMDEIKAFAALVFTLVAIFAALAALRDKPNAHEPADRYDE